MAAKKSGGTGSRLKGKNQAMAAQMKTKGIVRNTGKCPICNKQVSLANLYGHVISCKG